MKRGQYEVSWGLLPAQVKSIIRQREWDSLPSLKARLLGIKAFPIRVGLKPPKGNSAILDIVHFQRFIDEWKSFPHQDVVEWSSKNFRELSEQRIPTFVVIESMQCLIQFLGSDALSRSKVWERNMKPFLWVNKDLYPALVKCIDIVEKLSLRDAELLAKLLPQLKQGLGEGQYLRALPLIGIDTKFLENHQILIEELADIIHKGAVSASGGLIAWLGCSINPKGWLTIRPLCRAAMAAFGGIPILQIPGELLRQYELPASNILVVENLQSGLALPEMPDTVAVIGGGKNIAWMNAAWLKGKRVGYWGDIDTWGLSILSDARDKFMDIEPLMMDVETVKAHEDRMVPEPNPVESNPTLLNEDEAKLFNDLISGRFQSSRLEQERLSSDYIRNKLMNWLS
ncbi:Wadjet anti-phage system protein JetD domain-containing protein [Photorhabdus kayaii]|uniref:Wadjet anti-phage system protein JetD domain-containing protein n=1 Tax=Photorhabdus kayaii TaxID=230088 RepID=UPI0021D4DF5B|nr:Wadjet anti-phage system protein JetD domain-containing protein [Photorhabdus kayaii]MCT8351779.1 DUF2220 family protein [Photorhabdus kayaii]